MIVNSLPRCTKIQCMSNGLKNLQSVSRAAARRERTETGQHMQLSFTEDDDSGISGMGINGVDDIDVVYRTTDEEYRDEDASGAVLGPSVGSYRAASYHSSPGSNHSCSGSSTTSAPGYSTTASASMSGIPNTGHSNMPGIAAMNGTINSPYGYPTATHHGYTSSVSSTGTSAGYGAGNTHPGSTQGGATSPYIDPTNSSRLSSVDMGIGALINPPSSRRTMQ